PGLGTSCRLRLSARRQAASGPLSTAKDPARRTTYTNSAVAPTVRNAMSTARIVVVEDEHAIRRGVADALRASGFEVVEAADGARGLEEAARAGVHLVLLDLLLPKRDGLAVLADLRKVRPTLPVIILTARGSEDDRVRGLKMGADDYVVKPFSARELLARVEAVLRRSVVRP